MYSSADAPHRFLPREAGRGTAEGGGGGGRTEPSPHTMLRMVSLPHLRWGRNRHAMASPQAGG
jgi:hypothetical protein